MALSDRIRKRLTVWRWRMRYWWLDTEAGAQAHIATFCLSVLVVIAQLVRVTVAAAVPAAAPEPKQAVVWWVVQLIVALVAFVVSYVMRPKMPKQPDPKQEPPTVEDGLAVDDHFGEVWIDDPPVLAWKVVRTEKIKSKAKK